MKRDEALLHVAQLTTKDRNLTHGDPILQFETAQQLKDELARGPHWVDLTAVEKEAVEMICTKLSRLVHGDPNLKTGVGWSDHFLDIIGYAAIAIESRHIEIGIDDPTSDEEEASARRMAHRLVKTPAPERSEIDALLQAAKQVRGQHIDG